MSINCFLFTIVLLNVVNASTLVSRHFSTRKSFLFFFVYNPFHVISCCGSIISKIGVKGKKREGRVRRLCCSPISLICSQVSEDTFDTQLKIVVSVVRNLTVNFTTAIFYRTGTATAERAGNAAKSLGSRDQR